MRNPDGGYGWDYESVGRELSEKLLPDAMQSGKGLFKAS